jgi:carbonic anhydrase
MSMSITDELLRANEAYAESFTEGELPMPPEHHVAVVACMDARLDLPDARSQPWPGACHPQREGVVGDDAIRSLMISSASSA